MHISIRNYNRSQSVDERTTYPVSIYMLKFTIETLEQAVNMFKVNNKNTYLFQVFLLLTLNM